MIMALTCFSTPATSSCHDKAAVLKHVGYVVSKLHNFQDREDKSSTPCKQTAPVAIIACSALVLALKRKRRGRKNLKTVMSASGSEEDVRRRDVLLSSQAAALAPALQPSCVQAVAGQPLQLPNFGIGAWSWGDRLFWGYDDKQDADIRAGFQYCINNGVKLVDTAELYGPGRSEELLGKFVSDTGADVLVATKFGPLPWKAGRSDVVSSCKASLGRLGMSKIDLYQIHYPFAWGNEAIWDGLGDCYEQGLVKAVGVSNYGSSAVRAIHAKLAERGIPLTSNQIQYSLLYRYPELNGMKATCDELGVRVLAYSPLYLGALVGKWDATHLPSGPRQSIAEKLLQDPSYKELLDLMRKIAADRGPNATPSQVALAWCIGKGTIPIPGVRNVKQAQDNVQAMALTLTARELEDLDKAASAVKPPITPDTNPMPRQAIDSKQQFFEA